MFKEIDILGTDYNAFEFQKKLLGDDGENWGLAHKDDKYIEWTCRKSNVETLRIFGHEVGHALFEELHYPKKIDEEQAANLCGDMLKTLYNNPKVLKWVVKMCKE